MGLSKKSDVAPSFYIPLRAFITPCQGELVVVEAWLCKGMQLPKLCKNGVQPDGTRVANIMKSPPENCVPEKRGMLARVLSYT